MRVGVGGNGWNCVGVEVGEPVNGIAVGSVGVISGVALTTSTVGNASPMMDRYPSASRSPPRVERSIR